MIRGLTTLYLFLYVRELGLRRLSENGNADLKILHLFFIFLKLFCLSLFPSPLQVLKNPVVFMVIVGIVAHFALGQQIPAVLSEFIDGLANSFGGAALFYLGLTMVSLVLSGFVFD